MPKKKEPPKEVSTEVALDSCPWCDGAMRIMMNAWGSACWVKHKGLDDCVFDESTPFETPEEAADAWNNRVND